MNLFDIIGPVMVGPSSSHTAGAVRIGYVARRLLDAEPECIELLYHGSFADTGRGHGTDKALVAGLLGMLPDDIRIPGSLELAKTRNIQISQGKIELHGAHPNTVLIRASAKDKNIEIVASSLGGGRIRINRIDGIETGFSGDSPTLIITNQDRPGRISEVASLLAQNGVNIASMQVYRNSRGGHAIMVMETDQQVPKPCVVQLRQLEGVCKVAYLEAFI